MSDLKGGGGSLRGAAPADTSKALSDAEDGAVGCGKVRVVAQGEVELTAAAEATWPITEASSQG